MTRTLRAADSLKASPFLNGGLGRPVAVRGLIMNVNASGRQTGGDGHGAAAAGCGFASGSEGDDCPSDSGMPIALSRREFLGSAAMGAFGTEPLMASSSARSGALAVGSANGLRALDRAVELLRGGADPLEAAVAAVSFVEADPNDWTVGYGGLPNEEGVVELDAAVMHGPTHRAGAVAALRGIRHPSQVAKLVMERTDHVLLVGEGAQRFAMAHGFKVEDLLTERARKIWLYWKETHSDKDDWLPPPPDQVDPEVKAFFERPTGTIHVSVRTPAGDLAACTSTSGLAFKIPGRVGDSPIVGAGLFVDNDVGAAGSTGRGEANLVQSSCALIVEFLRRGMKPVEACLALLERIVQKTRDPRLLKAPGKPNFQLIFYALTKDGQYGAASLWKGKKYAVHDGTQSRLLDCAYLLE
jgi:N4-(beta-N-acetylglucosaminyl)-L-asparaginase